MGDDDMLLLERWVGGEAAAGNTLFRRYFEPLYRFFDHKTQGDVDDLVQETFVACLKSRDAFRRQSSFRTYLFAIARHVLFGYWRRRSSPSSAQVPLDELSIASLSTSVGTKLARQEERDRLIEALRALSMDQQMMLELFYWHDMSREQLAEVFDIETATVGSRLFRARQMLMERLGSRSPNPLPTQETIAELMQASRIERAKPERP